MRRKLLALLVVLGAVALGVVSCALVGYLLVLVADALKGYFRDVYVGILVLLLVILFSIVGGIAAVWPLVGRAIRLARRLWESPPQEGPAGEPAGKDGRGGPKG